MDRFVKNGSSWDDHESGESVDASDLAEMLGRLPEGTQLIVLSADEELDHLDS